MRPVSPSAPKRKPIWLKSSTPNLFRYRPTNTYYVRVKVAGRVRRATLGTTSYRTACDLLPGKVREIKHASGKADIGTVRTLSDALAIVRAQMEADPAIMDSTRESYRWTLRALESGKARLPDGPCARLTAPNIQAWWHATAAAFAPQQANHCLRWARRIVEVAREAGALYRDPTKELKRLGIVRKVRILLTAEQFHAVIARIRGHRKYYSRDIADWLEFAAYSGLRPGEMMALEWGSVDEEKGTIFVGAGKSFNLTGDTRKVPMIPAMQELLTRMREGRECVGRIFRREQRPRGQVLKRACAALGFPHQRVYDLRHLFATFAIQSGVDVPTLSRWLGHRDGGALAMKTYVHPHTVHSQEIAKKVLF
jgi:integrase